jgi:P4 family phage/plasmid primase-like protien
MSTSSTTAKMKSRRTHTVQTLLSQYRLDKQPSSDKAETHTNTRIGSKEAKIHGGTYVIPDSEYGEFINKIKTATLNGQYEYLTEKQLVEGPLAIDMDLHYDYEVEDRQHNKSHIDDLIDVIFSKLNQMYVFNAEHNIMCYVMQKPDVNRVKEKNITKDGIHLLINVKMDRTAMKYLREQLISSIPEIWDVPIINTWGGVFDEGVMKGTVNWQLYGSRKPHHGRYSVSYIYEIGYDESDNEFIRDEINDVQSHLEELDWINLSVRNPNVPAFPLKTSFMPTYEKYLPVNKTRTQYSRNNVPVRKSGGSHYKNPRDYGSIQSQEELDAIYNEYMDSFTNNDYELITACKMTMILPSEYYGNGSYDKWIRVCWALKNTSLDLLVCWLKFSSQSPSFRYPNSIMECIEKWDETEIQSNGGLTIGSICHWAKTSNPSEYKEIQNQSVYAKIDQSINYAVQNSNLNNKKTGICGDADFADVLYTMKGDEYVAAAIKTSLWYRFINHRYEICDSGTALRNEIGNTMRSMYNQKAQDYLHESTFQPEEAESKEAEMAKVKAKVCMNVFAHLGKTTDKEHIMIEARHKFYKQDFYDKLDQDPYLMGFKNGVMDFREKVFRQGKPDDYISMSTHINYVKLDKNDAQQQEIVNEITEFLHQLFPIEEEYEYMFDHLASTLIGNSVNQTFTMYTGEGRNGKSVLVSLMGKILGDYKVDVPLGLICGNRVAEGGTSAEKAALKGARYAVFQEPRKGDKINEGKMKELTSGKDAISCRAPYMPNMITFIPQATFAIACNIMMEVDSNDGGTWRRIRVAEFLSYFTENPVDNDPNRPYQFPIDCEIDNKFDRWKEVFMSMLIERVLKTNGYVKDCDMVMAASNKYKQSQDLFSQFFEERIILDADSTLNKSNLYEECKVWYSNNANVKCPTSRELADNMDKMYRKNVRGKWKGIAINYGNDNDDDNDEIKAIADVDPEELTA